MPPRLPGMKTAEQKEVDSFSPPTKPEELIVWANRRFDDAARLDEFSAKQNLAFILGQQWGIWDQANKKFQQPTAQRRGDPNAPVRITINKIGGIVERVIARLTKNVPSPEVRPVTDTQSDVNAAKVGTRILDHELNARLKWDQRLVELYFWVAALGWSFLHVRWDPNAGTVMGEDEEGAVHQGEIVLDEVPAFEIRVDPNARRWRDAWFCVREVAMTKEAVYQQYGKIPTGTSTTDSMAQEWRLTSPYTDADGRSPASKTGSQKPETYVAVRQFWLRPGGRTAPNGLVFTWSGQTILEEPRPFPYQHKQLPFVPFNMLPALGGDPAGRTWVSDLIGMQRDYNDARSREATIRRTLTPKILAATGSIDPNRITSRVEVINYNPLGQAPRLDMPDGRWMAQFETAMNRTDQEMGDRAGMQEVSQGKAASSAPAAGILALQEADETKLAISAKEMAASIEHLGHQILMLVKQFWSEERTIRTWSRDGQLEVDQFSGADLGEQLDVHVSSESALPRSKSARSQMAMDLLGAGILTNPQDVVRMMDLPGSDFLVETLSLDSKQAEREHGHLLRGEDVVVRIWHNHDAHIRAHDEFRKSEEYEQLDPELQAHFDGHVDAHYQLVLTQMQQPTPPNTPMAKMQEAQANANPNGTSNPSGENGQPVDPMTGRPSDPNAIGGQSTNLGANQQGPIGGAGNQGPVPGQGPDDQLYRTGN
jgi:hypothetical protein